MEVEVMRFIYRNSLIKTALLKSKGVKFDLLTRWLDSAHKNVQILFACDIFYLTSMTKIYESLYTCFCYRGKIEIMIND